MALIGDLKELTERSDRVDAAAARDGHLLLRVLAQRTQACNFAHTSVAIDVAAQDSGDVRLADSGPGGSTRAILVL
jgi:hypothetical protein